VLIFSIALLATHSLIRNDHNTKKLTFSVFVVIYVFKVARLLLAALNCQYVFSESFKFLGGNKGSALSGFFGSNIAKIYVKVALHTTKLRKEIKQKV
jgi:hypothetical protein